MRRRLASIVAAAALVLALATQAYADTQGSSPAAAPADNNVLLGVIVVALLIGSLVLIRPRPKR